MNLEAIRPDQIVEARFKLSSKANDILDILFTKIDIEKEVLEYEINVADYKKFYEGSSTNIYRDFKKAVDSFLVTVNGEEAILIFKLTDEFGNEIKIPWFTEIHYLQGVGIIKLSISPKLYHIFVHMRKRVYYNINYSLNLKSIYAKRLYYYLKSFQDTNYRIDKLYDLIDKLQCPKSYEKWAEFDRKVIKIAEKEINEKTDIKFKYKPKKVKTKAYTHIEFFITIKETKKNKNGYSNKNSNKKNSKEKLKCANFEERNTDYENIEKILGGVNE